MHPDLKNRRRVFMDAYSDYLRADNAWHDGLSAAARLVPEVLGRNTWMIGQPGSRLRGLYDRRARALHRMLVARAKLATAQARLSSVATRMRLEINYEA